MIYKYISKDVKDIDNTKIQISKQYVGINLVDIYRDIWTYIKMPTLHINIHDICR